MGSQGWKPRIEVVGNLCRHNIMWETKIRKQERKEKIKIDLFLKKI